MLSEDRRHRHLEFLHHLVSDFALGDAFSRRNGLAKAAALVHRRRRDNAPAVGKGIHVFDLAFGKLHAPLDTDFVTRP